MEAVNRKYSVRCVRVYHSERYLSFTIARGHIATVIAAGYNVEISTESKKSSAKKKHKVYGSNRLQSKKIGKQAKRCNGMYIVT
jgi:hypothetical protein